MVTAYLLQAPVLPSEFFTLQSMLTLTGATGVVFVISNSIQRVFDFNPKWLALLIAQILAIVGVIMTKQTAVSDFFIGIVNGFLIYSTAVGANQITGNPGPQNNVARGHMTTSKQTNERRFNSKWF
jgi:hypothetical protein